jgi:hypothetical protein
MTTFKKTLLALTATLSVLAISLPSQAAMTPQMEQALIDVCKAVKSNSPFQLKTVTKSYRLNTKTVAIKLMCNGESVINFAESNNAVKTAATLQQSIGNVSISDVAAVSKVKVTF